jgi:hypothetical protein
MKNIILSVLLLIVPTILLSQTNGNGQGKAWVVLTSQYNTSPFNSTTDVNVYFDGSDYNGNITSVQFRLGYDGNSFTSVNDVVNLLGSDYVVNYNDDLANDRVLISVVYTASGNETIPDGAFVTVKLNNVPSALIYNQEQNRSSFNFSGFTPIGSNSLGNDVTLSSLNHGGLVKIPHRRYFGFVQDYATLTGVPNLEYQLIKNSGPGITGTIQTVLTNQLPTTTNQFGYYELIYYEHYYGYFVEGQTEFSFLFKTEALSGTESSTPPSLSTTDSYLQLRYATNKEVYTPIQLLASDVNQSHTSTIADAYSSFARFSNRFANWQNLGPGGYRDVMIIDPKDRKYLEYEKTVQTQLGVGPLGFKPKMTNWIYVLKNYINYEGPNSHSGQHQFEKDFFVVLMGDVNGTGIGGQPKPGVPLKENPLFTITDTTDTVFVQIPDVIGSVGEHTLVDIKINTKNVGVSSFGFQLNYNSETLQLVEAKTSALATSWMLYFNSDSLNVIDFGGMDGSAGDFPIKTSSYESIIQFKFKVLNNITIDVPLQFGKNKTAGNILGKDVVVVTTDGNLNTNGISTPIQEPTQFPTEIALRNAYPNPFNPSTVITVDIPSSGEYVSLEVYDLLGRPVRTIYNGRLIAGTHRFTFDASGLATGTYIYKLKSENSYIVKKMMLLK